MQRIEKQILKVLRQPSSIWKLFKEVDENSTKVINTLNKLSREGILEQKNNKFALTKKGLEVFKRERLSENVNFSQLLKRTKVLCRERPKINEELQQAYPNLDDIITRVRLLYENCELQNTDILVIGDDASQSISLALTNLPKRVICLEIDQRIVDFVNKIASKEKLNLKAIKYDVRNVLQLNEKFDVFITDPIETLVALKLFLSRGVEKLSKEGSVYVTISKQEVSFKKFLVVQKMLHDMGFVITDILRDLFVYPEKENLINSLSNPYKDSGVFKMVKTAIPDVDYYSAHLIRAEAIGNPIPLVKGPVKIGKEFYEDSENII